MRMFTAADLQRNASEVQRATAKGPVVLSYHEKPRFVMMTLEDYVHLGGVTIKASPDSFPDSVMARIREIEDAHPVAEHVICGGLADLLEDEGSNGPLP